MGVVWVYLWYLNMYYFGELCCFGNVMYVFYSLFSVVFVLYIILLYFQILYSVLLYIICFVIR